MNTVRKTTSSGPREAGAAVTDGGEAGIAGLDRR
jgi:hypothetical protein